MSDSPKKKKALNHEKLSRLLTAFLLCIGLLWPLVKTFGADEAVLPALALSTGCLILWSILGSLKKGWLWIVILLAAFVGVQFFLPNLGFIGTVYEAVKAMALYFNEVEGAATLFAMPVGISLAVILSVICYAFSAKSAGFLPAAILVVLMLFGMWSLGRAQYLWYSAPALIALLLLISQTSHEKINLFSVFPVAAVLVVLALIIVPNKQVDIEPMYDAAMEAKQTITDYLFFDDPRSVFSLGNYGYYPMGNGRLGGPVEQYDFYVMQVKTPKRTLMRAISKDEYTGRQWLDTTGGSRYLYVNPRWRKLKAQAFSENLPAQSLRSTSHILDEKAVSVLVEQEENSASTVYTPTFLRSFSSLSDMVPYFNDSGELFITRSLQKGDSYTVITPILEGGDEGLGDLVTKAARTGDDNYTQILQQYTKLPDHYSSGLDAETFREQVNNLVKGASTPYEKAMCLMNYLRGNQFHYTLTPENPPEDVDFVTYFFFRSREGYCTYFASAMTVMCRMAGLPARYVEGFVANPGEEGIAYVTAADAHAWTEVYFEGFGWVPFDATPSDAQDDRQTETSPEPTPTPTPTPPPETEEEPTPTPPPESEDEPEPSEEPDTYDNPPDEQDPSSFPWWILLILLALALVWFFIIKRRTPDAMAASANSETSKVFVYGNACAYLMSLRGRNPSAGETPMAFAKRMDRQKAFPISISPLWSMLSAAGYSRHTLNAEATARAKQTYHELYRHQNLFTKLRFLFGCAFDRKCYTMLQTPMIHEPVEKKYDFRITQAPTSKKGKKQAPDNQGFEPNAAWKAERASRLEQLDEERRMRENTKESTKETAHETVQETLPEVPKAEPQPARRRRRSDAGSER